VDTGSNGAIQIQQILIKAILGNETSRSPSIKWITKIEVSSDTSYRGY
jgi:hypothetical protein